MKHNFERFLSLLLAFVMVLGLFPMGHAHVHAAEDLIMVLEPVTEVTTGVEYVIKLHNTNLAMNSNVSEWKSGYTGIETAATEDFTNSFKWILEEQTENSDQGSYKIRNVGTNQYAVVERDKGYLNDNGEGFNFTYTENGWIIQNPARPYGYFNNLGGSNKIGGWNSDGTKFDIYQIVEKNADEVDPWGKRNWTKVSVDTETIYSETEGQFKYAWDGNSNTIWHSNWQNAEDKLTGENTFTGVIDFGKSYTIDQFSFTGRQDKTNTGNITQASLYVSNVENPTEEDWTAIVEHAIFEPTNTKKTICFTEQAVRYVKFVAEQSDDGWVTVSEFDIDNVADEHTATSVVTDPTCVAAGYTTYTCTCGSTYKLAGGAATDEHTMVPPTCEAAGYCSVCNAAGEDALGHLWTDDADTVCDREGCNHTRVVKFYDSAKIDADKITGLASSVKDNENDAVAEDAFDGVTGDSSNQNFWHSASVDDISTEYLIGILDGTYLVDQVVYYRRGSAYSGSIYNGRVVACDIYVTTADVTAENAATVEWTLAASASEMANEVSNTITFAVPMAAKAVKLVPKQTDGANGTFINKIATCQELEIFQATCRVNEHNYTSEVTTAPTCKDTGVRTYTCTYCFDSYEETVDATGIHTPVTADYVKPTLCTPGQTGTTTCGDCGEPISENTKITKIPVATVLNGDKKIALNNCEYTYNGTSLAHYDEVTGTTYTVKPASFDTTSDISGKGGQAPQTISVWNGLNLVWQDNGSVWINGNGSLHIWSNLDKPYWDKCGSGHGWNDGSGTHDLYLFVAGGEGTEIPGYTRVSNPGEAGLANGNYLIAAQKGDDWYVMVPSESNNAYDHLALVSDEMHTITGHTEGEAVQENVAEDGSYESVVYCSVCGTELSRDEITVTPPEQMHFYDEGVVTAPTCTAGGYTTYTCTICGVFYTDNETEALGHAAADDDGDCTTAVYCVRNCGTIVTPGAEDHTYTNDYDPDCNVEGCNATREVQQFNSERLNKLTGEASSNDVDDGSSIGEAFDGFDGTTGNYWASVQNDNGIEGNEWLIANLNGEYLINKVEYAKRYHEGQPNDGYDCTGNLLDYIIEVRVGNGEWQRVAAGATESQGTTVITFAPIHATQVRLTATQSYHWQDGTNGKPDNRNKVMSVAEFAVHKAVCLTDEHTEGAPVTEGKDTVVYCTVCGTELSRRTPVIVECSHEYDYECSTNCNKCGEKTREAAHLSDAEHPCAAGKCVYCKQEVLPYTMHIDGEPVVENENAATCTVDGSYDSVVYCTVCKAETSRETKTIPALGHNSNIHADASEPSCEFAGNLEYWGCTICNGRWFDEERTKPTTIAEILIPALGHDYESEVVWVGSCTEGMIIANICANCGDSYEDVLPAPGHNWGEGEVTIPATCAKEGVKTFTCSGCGETKTESIPVNGEHAWDDDCDTLCNNGCNTIREPKHTYDDGVQTKAPTCTEEGVTKYTCECGYFYTEAIPALGHCWEWKNTDHSAIHYSCCECNATNPNFNTVVYFDNTETKWETVTAAYRVNGISSWAVSQGVEGNIHTFLIHKDAVNIDFRNGSAGSETITTRTFEVVKDKTYDANLFVIYFQENSAWDKITVMGYADKSYDTTLAYSSSATHKDGKHILYVDKDALVMLAFFYLDDNYVGYGEFDVVEGKTYFYPACNHAYDEGVVTKAPTCSETGIETFTCSICGGTKTDTIPATGNHSPAEPVTENENTATCGADGSYDTVVYCSVCEKELSREANTVPATGEHIPGTPYIDSESETAISYELVTECFVCFTELSRVVVDKLADKVVVREMDVLLEAEIKLVYTVKIPEELVEGAKIVMTKNGKTVTYENLKAAEDGYYHVAMPIASGEMTASVGITVYDAEGNALDLYRKNGENMGTSAARTVVDYAKTALANEANSAAKKNLVEAMLVYGGYAQTFFNVDAENPAYAALGITPDLTAVDMDHLATFTNSQSNAEMGVKASTITAFLDSNIRIRVYLTVEGDIDDYTFVVSGPNGTTTVAAGIENGRYYVEITEIASGLLDEAYTITVTKGEATNVITTSALSYFRSVIANPNNTEAKKNLARAMYLYNQAANELFGK